MFMIYTLTLRFSDVHNPHLCPFSRLRAPCSWPLLDPFSSQVFIKNSFCEKPEKYLGVRAFPFRWCRETFSIFTRYRSISRKSSYWQNYYKRLCYLRRSIIIWILAKFWSKAKLLTVLKANDPWTLYRSTILKFIRCEIDTPWFLPFL